MRVPEFALFLPLATLSVGGERDMSAQVTAASGFIRVQQLQSQVGGGGAAALNRPDTRHASFPLFPARAP